MGIGCLVQYPSSGSNTADTILFFATDIQTSSCVVQDEWQLRRQAVETIITLAAAVQVSHPMACAFLVPFSKTTKNTGYAMNR